MGVNTVRFCQISDLGALRGCRSGKLGLELNV